MRRFRRHRRRHHRVAVHHDHARDHNHDHDHATTVTTTTTTTTTTTVAPPPTTAPAGTVGDGPAFRSSVAPVTAEELGASWREGCPVGPDELRNVTLAHHTGDGRVVDGVLVVHADHVDDVIDVFSALHDAAFPITSMRPVSEFGADDDQSMAADNSSAFNCRVISGTDRWSEHAYGTAIDINPIRNPWVRGSVVDPPAGAAYLDRNLDEPGLIKAGDVVTQAFAAIGWGWGGNWSSSKDYQHFSASGR